MPAWFLFLVPGQTYSIKPIPGHGNERTRKQPHSLDPRPETSTSQTTTDGDGEAGGQHGVPWRHTYTVDAWKAARETDTDTPPGPNGPDKGSAVGREPPGLMLTTDSSRCRGGPGPTSTDVDIRSVVVVISWVWAKSTARRFNPDKISRSKRRPAQPLRISPCRAGTVAEADMLRRHPMGKIRWLAG